MRRQGENPNLPPEVERKMSFKELERELYVQRERNSTILIPVKHVNDLVWRAVFFQDPCANCSSLHGISVDFLESVDFSFMLSLDPVILLILDVATAKPCSSISEPQWHLLTLLSS